MFFLRDTAAAVGAYQKAWQLVSTKKLWSLIIWSGLAYLLLAIAGVIAIGFALNNGIDYIFDLSWFKAMQDKVVLKYLLKAISFSLYLASFLLFFSLYKYIFLIVGSPLFAYISERAEYAINGNVYDFKLDQFITDVIRGVQISGINFVKQTSLSILLLVLGFVPIIGLISPFLMLYLDAYYYGFSMLDYNCERKKMSVSQSLQFTRARKGAAFGNGIIFYLLFLIPVIGMVVGAPLSAIAASIQFSELESKPK